MKYLVRLCLAVMLLLGSVGVAGKAYAHAGYSTSSPGIDAVLQQAPSEVWVRFTEEVSTRSTLDVWNAAGARVDRGDLRRDADQMVLRVSLPPVGPGRYRVHFVTITDDDNGRVEGDFLFTVAGAAQAAAPVVAPLPPAVPVVPAATPVAAPAPVTPATPVVEADGPVHAHLHVDVDGDLLHFTFAASNHLDTAISNLEVHIPVPHGTTYVASNTDDGQRPAYDGRVARYEVGNAPSHANMGPFHLWARVEQPNPEHSHPTITLPVWLTYQVNGQTFGYTSKITLANPLEGGMAHSEGGDHGH